MDISKLYFDYTNAILYVSDGHEISRLDSFWNPQPIFNSQDITIDNFFVENDKIYILTNLTNSCKLYTINSQAEYQLIFDFNCKINNVVFANYAVLISNDKIFDKTGKILYTFNNKEIICSTYNIKDDEIYLSTNKEVFIITKNTYGEYSSFKEVDFSLSAFEEISSISYFNGYLYLDIQTQNTHKLYKISTSFSLYDKYTPTYLKQNNVDISNALVYNNNFISNGYKVYSLENFKLLANSLPYNITGISRKKYNKNDYMVCTSGYYLLISKINYDGNTKNERWSSKIIYNNGDENTSNDSFIGIDWDGNYDDDEANAYVFSQSKIYYLNSNDTINNKNIIYNLFDGITNIDSELQTYSNKWYTVNQWEESKNSNYSTTTDAKCSYILEAPKNCIITGLRYTNNDVYVALHNTSINVSDDSYQSGIYKLTKTTVSGKPQILLSSTSTVPLDNIKAYMFDYINGYWYYSNGQSLYKYLGNNTSKELSDITLKNGQSISNISKILKDNVENIRVFLNDGTLIEQNTGTNALKTISTKIAFDESKKLKLYNTPNTLLIDDGQFVYNIIENNGMSDELYQICFVGLDFEGYKLIQSNNSIFMLYDGSLKNIPLNNRIYDSTYYTGYYTDSVPHKWSGAAPYFYISNVLQYNKYSCSRLEFLNSLVPSFEYEFCKLMNDIPNAYIDNLKQIIQTSIENEGLFLEGDNENIVLNQIINSVSKMSAEAVGMFITDRFAEQAGNREIQVQFAKDVLERCISDTENDITKDFYNIYIKYAKEILKDALMGYNAITDEAYNEYDATGENNSLQNLVVKYYQNHKMEWCNVMIKLIESDIVNSDIYLIPLKSTEYSIKISTYIFKDNQFVKCYYPNVSFHFSKDKIIYGYLNELDGKFYEDEQYTLPIAGNVECIYINNSEKYIKVNFSEHDTNYHNKFYNDIIAIKNSLSSSLSLEELRRVAISKLQNYNYAVSPSDEWKAIISEAVNELYIPQQGENYRAIVRDSNMNPIHWDELPNDINVDTFTYALDIVLNIVKATIIYHISALVDKADVLCYSCMDASSIIGRLISKNTVVYKNIRDMIIDKVTDAKSKEEILDCFNTTHIELPTDSNLIDILNIQSALYAKYMTQIVTNKIINEASIDIEGNIVEQTEKEEE